ncbi:hypothetical protein B0920_23735 [Massilia sp. KIM]|nr:CocE/NonD family hydrolase [Massilia sp. KIM]OON59394.1 hypothetical protein B0920_23735 [Massilia sp. KIM]
MQSGYVAVIQNVRGTFLSEGTFDPMYQEADDGYDAVEWAAAQHWSNGRVGMKGASYLGLTQWQAALAKPPHLVAIAPDITASDYHDNWLYVNGVLDLWFAMTWPAGSFEPDQITRNLSKSGATSKDIDANVQAWLKKYGDHSDSIWPKTLPVTSIQSLLPNSPYFSRWLGNPTYNSDWDKLDVEGKYGSLSIPTLNSGASYDIFSVGTVRNFKGMRSMSSTEVSRKGARLVLRAYGHAGDSGMPTFGDDTPDAAIEARFFERYLKGVANGFENDPVANIFVMLPPDQGQSGTGFWVQGDDFPLPGTIQKRYYIGSRTSANSMNGDGYLSTSIVDSGTAADNFVYNPNDPVPTTGGNLCCNPASAVVTAGARDQERVASRTDVLVYTSEPMVSDMAIIGNVKASFWASSTAIDTDFTVKVVGVRPDGKTHNIVDRIVRASLRAGSKLPSQAVSLRQPTNFELDLGPTAMMIPKGHKLRVQVSSSDFPHYARNLNTGKNNYTETEAVIAQQSILHDAKYQSYIEIPIAPVVRPKT